MRKTDGVGDDPSRVGEEVVQALKEEERRTRD